MKAGMMQAYLTMRKGNKKAAIYDLELSFTWAGRLTDEDASEEVRAINCWVHVIAGKFKQHTMLPCYHCLAILKI